MKFLADRIMGHRAGSLFARVRAHLPGSGTIADIGSGTGHLAAEIRRRTTLAVREFDVADVHWVGPGPMLINGNRVPAADCAFDGLVLLFVLQYPDSPQELLREARRLSKGPLIVLQSVYRGWWGRAVLGLREFVWGRLAMRVAGCLRLVRPVEDPLRPRRGFTLDGGRRARLWWLFWEHVRRLPLSRAKAMPALMFCTGVSSSIVVSQRQALCCQRDVKDLDLFSSLPGRFRPHFSAVTLEPVRLAFRHATGQSIAGEGEAFHLTQ